MANILNVVGTGDLLTNERPEGWGGLAWLTEASKGSLAILTSLLPADEVVDPKFHWFEMGVPTFQIYTNVGNLLSTSTVLTFDDSTGAGVSFNVRTGTKLLNTRTNEIVRVTADPGSNTATVTVSRAFGTTAAAAILDNDVWVILASAEAPNAQSPASMYIQPSQKDNYVQIIAESLELDSIAAAVEARTGPLYQNMLRQRFDEIVRKIDRDLIHSQPVDGSANNTASSTGGVRYVISTYTKNFSGTVTEADLDTEMERSFRYGSDQKVLMGGGVALRVVNHLAKRQGQIMLTPKDTTYGLSLDTYKVMGYTIQLLANAHMKISEQADGTAIYNNWAFVLDTMEIRRKYLRGHDLAVIKDTQATKTLGTIKDTIRGSIGLQMGLEQHHARWQNMTNYNA